MQSPLLLLHGALGSQQQFDQLLPLLTPVFDVHAFNFSGHGGLPIHEAFSIGLFEENLLDFIAQHQLQSVDVFGYSMGGYVALQSALHHPGAIGRIMTLGTKLKWDPAIAAKEVKMLNPDVIEQKVPAFGESLKRRHLPTDWKVNMHATAAMMMSLGDGNALTATDFRQVQHDVLLCLGELDTMVSAEETKWVADLLPHGRYQIVPGWKHPIEAVEPVALAEAIRANFLPA